MANKRYNLVIPEALWGEYNRLAQDEGVPVVDVFRRALKAYLWIVAIENDPKQELILLQDDEEVTPVFV